MAKSRNDRWKAEALTALAGRRIWPAWARSLGAMIEAEAIVRFACDECRRVYDVDVESLAVLRGREWSLIGRSARCKASKCRARGGFVAAREPASPFLALGAELPRWLAGARPMDHEAKGDGPGPAGGGGGGSGLPPPPPGVDPHVWAKADERERKRIVRRVRD